MHLSSKQNELFIFFSFPFFFQLRRIAEFRKEHENLVKELLPEDEKKAFVEGNVVNVLTNKDHLGRRVLVVNSGKVWDPDQVSADQLFRLFYLGEFKLHFREL